ncbi:TetR family transcriptional regulator [Streptomyces botrytidirepellens]|uniref:TetR family transcriptional regulator n=1 Tax=Streptomyces botrytidirepellens TaxID=2486417 RepID=A0A3M8SQH7_9ACTN|nr:TetR family transcriptional regulator [Streptomyces botrytidirepellens]RNF83547.1 TetR family transcriptional regulator [Streptomyces botrytidirepellens]
MGRWEPGARERLQRAALELYVERGFEQTTVAEITNRAGLTERTFFRHFADKREVLFSGQDELLESCVNTIVGAPEATAPLDAVAEALQAISARFEERREFSRQRQTVIAANAGLQERELLKLAALASATADALRRRGVTEPTASLAAEAGVAVFKIAFERWIGEPGGRTLADVIQDSLDHLKAATAG